MNTALRRASRTRIATLPRDTETTAFTGLLTDLIDRIPGARAAALVDSDGESVDYAGALSPFDVKVAAAHWQIVMSELRRTALFQRPQQIVARGRAKSFVVRSLSEAYAVVVVLGPRAGFAPSTRAFLAFERALHAEAGIGRGNAGPHWTPIVVEQDGRGRPRGVRASCSNASQNVEVLGAVVGLGRGERGFRVRFRTGLEVMLVREPGGTWYADEPISLAR